MFTFETSNSKTYLVYTLNTNEEIDKLSLGMMSNNKIKGFLPVIYTQIDEKRMLKYDVTSLIPASQIFSGTVNRKWVLGIFLGITNAIIEAEEFMINPNTFVIDLNYVYVDISTTDANIVCLPLDDKNVVDYKSFFKNIMFSVQFDSSENNDYVAQIISYLNNNAAFSPYSFRDLLFSVKNGAFNTVVNNAYNNSNLKNTVVQNNFATTQKPITTQPPVVKAAPVTPASNKTFVNKTVNPINPVPLPRYNIPQNYNGQSFKPQVSAPPKNSGNGVSPVQYSPMQSVVNNAPIKQDKKMSMFYLMCHYNKENAQKYKEQKQVNNQPNIPPNQIGNLRQQVAVKEPRYDRQNSNFAVPGQPYSNMPAQNNISVNNVANVPAQPQKKQNTVYTQPVQNKNHVVAPVQNSYVSQNQSANNASSQPIQTVSADFGSTTVLGGEYNGETTVLGNIQDTVNKNGGVKRAFIIRQSNNEKIQIDKPVFRIGKERSYVDYFIGDNSYISRGHANIVERDGKYYIVDNNSRNHTYVNGNLITSSTEIELNSGDTFKLANEAFEFKLF